MRNPFTPTFGKVPLYLAGREYLIEELLDALENGPGDPNQASILVGARGTGKTATLAYLRKQAESMGWIAVSATCVDGMLQDILEQISRRAAHLVKPDEKRKVSGVSLTAPIGGLSFRWDNLESSPGNWRSRITDVLEELSKYDVGLLITVDEVDPRSAEMVELIAAFQHFVTEERKIALFMAGLPHKVSQLLNGESVSFLRRAGRKELGNISDLEVRVALENTASKEGKRFDEDALDAAVRSVNGFPYMMQLVGFRSWALSGDSGTIGQGDVDGGIALATEDLRMRVLKQTLDELSRNDLLFLQAMLPDDERSDTKRIAERLGKPNNHVSTYKKRLMDAGVVEPASRSSVGFALPGLRDYLPEYIEENIE